MVLVVEFESTTPFKETDLQSVAPLQLCRTNIFMCEYLITAYIKNQYVKTILFLLKL